MHIQGGSYIPREGLDVDLMNTLPGTLGFCFVLRSASEPESLGILNFRSLFVCCGCEADSLAGRGHIIKRFDGFASFLFHAAASIRD